MSKRYGIESTGAQFILIDAAGARASGYTTAAVEQDIERCMKEAAMCETAKTLVKIAIEAHMLIHEVDRETATRWVFSAMDVAH